MSSHFNSILSLCGYLSTINVRVGNRDYTGSRNAEAKVETKKTSTEGKPIRRGMASFSPVDIEGV